MFCKIFPKKGYKNWEEENKTKPTLGNFIRVKMKAREIYFYIAKPISSKDAS